MLCCQLIIQLKQKLFSETVDRFHSVSMCVSPGPVRSKLGGKMGQNPREAKRATRPWCKSDPEWRTQEREKQGWVETSLTEGHRKVQPKFLPETSCFSQEQACLWIPAIVIGKCSLWEVWLPLKCGHSQSTAAGDLMELGSLQSQPWEEHPHGRHGTPFVPLHSDTREISSMVPMGLSSWGNFFSSFNNLNFE